MTLYILGAGAHGRVVADIFASQGIHVDGFLDDDPRLHGTYVSGLLVVGSTDILLASPQPVRCEAIVALGNASLRLRLFEQLELAGHRCINAAHAQAVVSSRAILGRGICICAGAVINPDACVGHAVIINTGATVDHDCCIEEGAHLSPGVHLAGRVHVGRLSFLGTGAVVAPRVKIGPGAVIGAGAAVINDIPGRVLAVGVPARVVRELPDGLDWSRLL